MKFHLVTFVLIVSSTEVTLAEERIDTPLVELKQGKLKGFEEKSTDGKSLFSFLGIPFAEPPVGNLRFEDPDEPKAWDGILEANTMPSKCLQMAMLDVISGNQNISGSEDCLYLNVFTPKPLRTENNFPVMVYIHGGAFVGGSAEPFYPYALLNEEIVLVVIQYRVGVLGFLSTEDSSMPGNYGLKDQRMALIWIQENIRNFGGDPDRVTIFGVSAGGGSVHLQMLSPGSKGLFWAAIAQSGTGLSPRYISDQHGKYAADLGKLLNCNLDEGGEAFKLCIKKIDGPTLLRDASSLYKWGNIPLITVPRVDGNFIPDHPAILIKTGRYNKVNLMSGLVRDEGGFFTMFLYKNPKMKLALIEEFSTSAPYAVMVENETDKVNLSKVIFDFYLKEKKVQDNPLDELTEMFSDRYFKMGSDMSHLLHCQDEDINLYMYEFSHKGQRSVLDNHDYGLPKHYIVHGDELFYLFSGGPLYGRPLEKTEDIELRRKMTKLWTNFAKFGNPTPPGSFNFNWFPATAKKFQHLSVTTSPTMQNYTRKKALDFWKSLNMRLNGLLSGCGGSEKLVFERKIEL